MSNANHGYNKKRFGKDNRDVSDEHRLRMGLRPKKRKNPKDQSGSDIVVDHKDGNKSNNSTSNLRKMTRSEHASDNLKGNKNATGKHSYPKRRKKAKK